MPDSTWGQKYPIVQDDGDLKVHINNTVTTSPQTGVAGVWVTTYPEDNQPWLIDPDSNAVVTIPWEHHLVHEGYMYSAMHLKTGIANDGKYLVHFKTGAGARVHLAVELLSSTKAYATVYAGATVTNNGTQITTGANKLGSTAYPPDLTIYHTPTVGVNGSVMGTLLLGGGTKVNPSGGASRAGGGEWELAQSTSYWVLFEAKGGSGITTDVALEALFYREP